MSPEHRGWLRDNQGLICSCGCCAEVHHDITNTGVVNVGCVNCESCQEFKALVLDFGAARDLREPTMNEERIPMGDTAAYEKGFEDGVASKASKTLHNTKASGAKDNVPDIEFYGNGDLFKCLVKAWSKKEGWMKSTKAMEVPGGVVIQVSTQQGDHVAEAVCFVPGLNVVINKDQTYSLVSSAK